MSVNRKRRAVAVWLMITILTGILPFSIYAEEDTVNTNDLGLQSKAAVLMEASTGTIIYENNPDQI